jgi:organic hydroperoxide reductase OsmC/OhrA
MSATATRPTIRSKEARFPVSITWTGGRTVLACVDGKHDVPVAPPPVFRGTDPSVWSPEDMFVSAAASCLAVTYTGLVERAGIRLASLRVDGEGTVGVREDGRFGFTGVHLRLRAVVPPVDLDNAAVLASEAEARCLVAASFALPVDVDVDLRTSGE